MIPRLTCSSLSEPGLSKSPSEASIANFWALRWSSWPLVSKALILRSTKNPMSFHNPNICGSKTSKSKKNAARTSKTSSWRFLPNLVKATGSPGPWKMDQAQLLTFMSIRKPQSMSKSQTSPKKFPSFFNKVTSSCSWWKCPLCSPPRQIQLLSSLKILDN